MYAKFVAKTDKTCESQRVKLTLLSLSFSLFLSEKQALKPFFSYHKKISKMSQNIVQVTGQRISLPAKNF